MKLNLTTSKNAAIVLVLVLVTAANLFAQRSTEEKIKAFKANLIVGINSDNEGLKKSSIYFAGQYKVKEAVEPLIDLLQKEENSSIKVLIALVLFKIGGDEGIKAVKELSENDNDNYVKRMSTAILNAYSYEMLQVSVQN